jgi:hypothetical protein
MGQYSLGDIKAFAPASAPPPPPDTGFTMPGSGPSMLSAMRDTSPLGGALQTPDFGDIMAESGMPVRPQAEAAAERETAERPVFDVMRDMAFGNAKQMLIGGAKEVPREAINTLRALYQYAGPGAAESMLSAMTGREMPSNPVRDTALEAMALPSSRVPEPKEYGTFDESLQLENGWQKGGAFGTQLALTAALPVSRGAQGSRLLRIAKAIPREAAVGGVLGEAQSRRGAEGAVAGGILGGFMPGGAADEASQLAAAKHNAGMVLSPTIKENKRWVDQNWREFVEQSPWFAGLDKLQKSARAAADVAGQHIDDVLSNVRQASVAGKLKAARRSVLIAADNLLAQSNNVGVVLAPEARESLLNVSKGLRALNPTATSLGTLKAAQATVDDVLKTLQPELMQRAQQLAGLQEVSQVFHTALRGRAVKTVYRAGRVASKRLGRLADEVEPSRIETQPLLDRLRTFRQSFMGANDTTGAPIVHNQAAVDTIDGLTQQLQAYGSDMSVDAARNVRQIWDDFVAGARGKGFLSDMAEASKRGATKEGAHALRGGIADKVPEIVAPNRAYSWNTNLDDVISDTVVRRTGQTKGLGEKIAAIAGASVSSGGVIGAIMSGNPAGLAGVAGGALIYGATKLVKSPEFNLFTAKARLAFLDALRKNDVEGLRAVMQRMAVQSVAGGVGEGQEALPETDGKGLTPEEERLQQALIQSGQSLAPGATEPDTDPDGGTDPIPDRVPDEDDEPVDPSLDPEQHSPESVEEARLRSSPEVLRAGGGNLLQSASDLLEPASRPLLTAPTIEGHPTLTRMLKTAAQFTSPLDVGFAATSALRPLAAATRFAKPVSAVARTLAGATALQGAAGLQRGLDTGDPGQVIGGGLQFGLGALGTRAEPAATVKALSGRIGRRLLAGATEGGVNVVAGPTLALSAQELADSSAMRRLIPDEGTRASVASGLQILALGGSGVAFGAMAYKRMPPTRKALVHIAGDLAEGRSPAIARQKLEPMLTAHFQQKYPTWTPERIAEKVQGELASAEEKARTLVEQADAASGRKLTDVRRTERMIDTEQAVNSGWYEGARDMVEQHIPAGSNALVDPTTGLTPKQHFGLEALAAFGTNTPPADNFRLYKRVADIVAAAPDDLTRPELMEWLQSRAITTERVAPAKGRRKREVERVFGMDEEKPGIPALRAIIEGTKGELGGRKIESYFHNLAGIQRENAIGQMITPTTNDRWILRAMGLPTEIPLRTDEPVVRRTPSGAPVIDPKTGQPLVRGGDRRQRVVEGRVDPTRQSQLEERLMAEATKRAEARGTPITPRELARIERESQVLAQKFETPTVRQAHRSTAQGSEYVSSKTIADVGYEMTERNVMEAARRAGMEPEHAQAALWFREKYGSDLFGGRKGTQGLPLDQQQVLQQATEARLAETPVSGRMSAERQREVAEKLVTDRDTKLAKEITESIEANGGSTTTLSGQHRGGDDVTAVSIFPERQLMIPPAARNAKEGWTPAVVAFMQDNADLLRNPDYAIGGWVSTGRTPADRRAGKLPVKFGGREVPKGTLVLDVVATPSRGHNNLIAKTLGMEFNQYSVFDLLKFQEQQTGGMAWQRGSPAGRKAAAARRPGVYERASTLDPAQIDSRIAALEADPRLSSEQAKMLKWWKRQRARQQREPAAAATAPEGDLGARGRVGDDVTATSQDTQRPLLREPGGAPLTLYHGSTSRDIAVTDLDPARKNVRPRSGAAGVSFTTDPRAASGYTRPPGAGIKTPAGRVLAAHVSMRHPLDITDAVRRLQKKGLSFGDAKRKALEALTPEHDGVVFRGDRVNPDEYQVFSRDQIHPVSE